MKRFIIQLTILLTVSIGALYLGLHSQILGPLFPGVITPTTQQIKINDTLIKVEVADTPAKRSKGLSGRESLATDSGMLFVYPQAQKYQFWMKGMKFALDMIFIKDGKVIDEIVDVPAPASGVPDTALPIYQPMTPIDMILEVNSGFAKNHNIKIGDQIFIVKQS
ncbi:DUF192 domain-containing protein [Candidatus Daviesbacteria bacterium]|nr:DUF192 domain-containing protein [Candidatus Daviesbacteria bacterium]